MQLVELLTAGDSAKAQRVMKAVLAMKKLELDVLQKAAA